MIRRARETDAYDFARGMKSVIEEGLLGPAEHATVARIEDLFEAGIKDRERMYLVADETGKLIGAILVYPDPDLDAYSLGLWVLPDRRDTGAGTALLEAGLEELPTDLDELRIEVWPDNRVAIRLFEKFGFGDKELSSEEYARVDGTMSRILRMRLTPLTPAAGPAGKRGR